MCAAAQTANRGQEGGGTGHAGRGRNAARWLSSLRALLLCWLPAALLHWRRTQRALASELSSGMPDEHDTALHSTREQPIRPINLARAGADGPDARRQWAVDTCTSRIFILAVSQSVITTLLPTEHMAHCTLDLLGAAGSLD